MQEYGINVSIFAENDLKAIVSYHFEKNPEYAKGLYIHIKNRINELKRFPERGKIVPELEQQGIIKYRQIVEGNYRIIFTVRKNEVNILIIVDSRRDLEKVLMIKLSEISER